MVDLIKKKGKIVWYLLLLLFSTFLNLMGGLDVFGIVELKGKSIEQIVSVIMDMHSRIALFWLIPFSIIGIILETVIAKNNEKKDHEKFLNGFFIFTIIMCFVILIGVIKRI